MSDNDLDRVTAALDTLLANHDPKTLSDVEFRGHRYDAGLAWVHFPEGFGGLGAGPELNRLVDERCRKAGAKNTDPSTFFMALAGPTIVTHGSDEQKRRFLERLEQPEKNWKFSPDDLRERTHWNAYQKAYEEAIRGTASKFAPWFVVPADNKWFTRLAVSDAIIDAMEKLHLKYPKIDDAKKKELAEARKILMSE